MRPPLQLLFPDVPVIRTAHLTLSGIADADAPALLALRGDPAIMRFIPRPLAETMEDAKKLISDFDQIRLRQEGITWGIRKTSDLKLIGTIAYLRTKPEHYRSEVGYLLGAGHHGKGFMTEALQAVLSFGFNTMHLHSIEAVVDPENTPSRRVLERCGFIQEGHLRENQYFQGRFLDSMIYTLLQPGDTK